MSDKALGNAKIRRAEITNGISSLTLQIENLKRELARVERFIEDWAEFAGENSSSNSSMDESSPPERNFVPTLPPIVRSPIARWRPSRNSRREDVARAAREIIKLYGTPMSRRDLYPLLTAEGLTIEGANPDMVLSTMLWRSKDLIVRLPKYGYWLADEPFELAGYVPGDAVEDDGEDAILEMNELTGDLLSEEDRAPARPVLPRRR